ncbi:MAG: biotin--[acetyl-CoA-carboxylase] ligase [Aestuariivirgaceae bacterium]|nr:biotin--[acetyl-CoA-carboxylase] ligase [Aestuariivirgaceae bacterium]
MGNPSLPPGYQLIRFDDIDSTNLEALRRARQGEAGPLWIWAERQTQGRGRQGREWVSDTGNLYATLLVTLNLEPQRASGLSFVAALALADTLAMLVPNAAITLKWPNDVLLNAAKAAGILIETELHGQRLTAAIGCGLNLAHAPENTRYPATSLAAAGVTITPARGLQHLAYAFATRLAQWEDGRNFAAIRTAWLAHAHALGQTVNLTAGPETITGTVTDLSAEGAMILTLANGTTRALHAGEVQATRQFTTGTTT